MSRLNVVNAKEVATNLKKETDRDSLIVLLVDEFTTRLSHLANGSTIAHNFLANIVTSDEAKITTKRIANQAKNQIKDRYNSITNKAPWLMANSTFGAIMREIDRKMVSFGIISYEELNLRKN